MPACQKQSSRFSLPESSSARQKMPSKSRRGCTCNERRLRAHGQTEAVVTERLEKVDVVDLIRERVGLDVEMAFEIVDAFLDQIHEAFKRGKACPWSAGH